MVFTARKAVSTKWDVTKATSGCEASSRERGRRRNSNLVVADSPAAVLGLRALLLRLQAAFLRRLRRPGPGSLLWPVQCLFHQCQQPGARGLTVLTLRAMFARVDEQNAIARRAPSRQRYQTRLHVFWQRGRGQIDAQFDRRGDLVDILAARSGSAYEPFVDHEPVEQ